jgi:hypothetical protein
MTAIATPQGISALLRKSGFARSDAGSSGVMADDASTGFTVWKTFHGNAPSQPYVAVQHLVKGMWTDRTDEGWAAYQSEARTRLEAYAKVVRAAGYAPVVRDRGTEPPWLIILTAATAKTEA